MSCNRVLAAIRAARVGGHGSRQLPGPHSTPSDLKAKAAGSGRLTVRRSTTDQEGKGATFYVGPPTMRAVRAWQAAAKKAIVKKRENGSRGRTFPLYKTCLAQVPQSLDWLHRPIQPLSVQHLCISVV